MKKLVTLLMVLCLVLTGCEGKKEDEGTFIEQKDMNVQNESQEVIDENYVDEIQEWDKTFVLKDTEYHVGDSIAELENVGWSWPSEVVPYVCAVPDGNVYITLRDIGYFSTANNYKKQACKPEECVVESISAMGGQIKQVIPNIPDMSKIKDFFGEQNITQIDEYEEFTSIYFRTDEYSIYVSGPEDGEVDHFGFDYGKYSEEDNKCISLKESEISERTEFDSFNMGMSTYVFMDKTNISELRGEYVKETDYTPSVHFKYTMGENVFSVSMNEVSSAGFGLSGLKQRGSDEREVDINGTTYVIQNSYRSSVEDGIRLCRYKGVVDFEVYTRNMTDELFIELLYELENVINVTDREKM
ncbi:MAG: hypothetical protein II992_09630 [Lachnospiraceae bacterium]|nr:hypothetical protein [Lachnospiraceae bacterium]MBQ3601441.1 hypothetical protein [Lachnospiraceae bacterium]